MFFVKLLMLCDVRSYFLLHTFHLFHSTSTLTPASILFTREYLSRETKDRFGDL